MFSRVIFALTAVAVVSCAGTATELDAADSGARTDGGGESTDASVDAGDLTDAGHTLDSGTAQDAGATDAGTDAGATDAGTDAGVTDAGTDAGVTDAGIDAGKPDAGAPDAGATTRTAAIVGDVLTLNGNQLGDIAAPAPLLYQNFASVHVGDDEAAVGLSHGTNDFLPDPTVASGDGFGAAPYALVARLQAGYGFPHLWKNFGGTGHDVHFAYAFKIHQVTSGGVGSEQIKGPRAGVLNTNGDGDRAPASYNSNPKQDISLFVARTANDFVFTGAGSGTYANPRINNDIGNEYESPEWNEGSNVALTGFGAEKWTVFDGYYRFNSVGLHDSQMLFRINGKTVVSLAPPVAGSTQADTCVSSQKAIEYFNFFPGFGSGSFNGGVWDYRLGHAFLSRGRHGIFLADASTLAACTKKYYLAPSVWSNTQIRASGASNRPAWATYVYVILGDGSVEESGVALP